MKKSLLFRLVAITVICFSSIAIKSENKICKVTCSQLAGIRAKAKKVVTDTTRSSSLYPYESFLIKI